ncbi:MAG: YdcF family protein, partial [bacterium]|nr:YdcF family protein [bacterium]
VRLLAFVVCCWITYALRTPILTAAGEFLVQPDPLEPAEIIVVLAGDGTGFRIMTAVGLVQRDLAPKILVTGPPGHYGHYESELAIDFAVEKGAPREIFEAFPMHVQSTKEEAERVDAELRRRGTAKAIIVTSNFHTRRTRQIFRERAGGGVEYIVAAAPNPYFEPDEWWKTRPGKKVFFMEAVKTVNSWIE